jgi:hypothetical protein
MFFRFPQVYASASLAAATGCMTLVLVVTGKSSGSPLALVERCFCWSKNATSKTAASRAVPAMRYDSCSASTNAWLIAWCSHDVYSLAICY